MSDSIITIGDKKNAPNHPVRFSYLTVDKPRKAPGAEKERYSVLIIVDKESPDVKRINAAMRAAHAATPALASRKFESLDLILRDGDNPKDNKNDDENLKGKVYFNAGANLDYPPDVVGNKVDPDTGRLERLVVVGNDGKRTIVRGEDGAPAIKSGDFGAVTVAFFGYSGLKSGVTAGLRAIQKRRNGPALGGSSSADADFTADDDEDDFMR